MPEELKIVECEGSPRELGRQYGEQAREEIQRNIDMWVGTRFKINDSFIANTHQVLERFIPSVLEELQGMAEGSNIPFTSILLSNHLNMFEPDSAQAGCTPIGLSDSDRGPLLAKNNDIDPDGRIHIIRKCKPTDGLPYLHVCNAGWLSGLDTFNAAGLCSAHGSSASPFNRTGMRLDVRLWTYHLMRTCKTTQEFLELFETVPLTGKGFNILLNDINGDTCGLEAAVPLIAYRDRGKPFIYATNHFITEELRTNVSAWKQNRCATIYRFGYLEWLDHFRPPESSESFLNILKSHEPWAPCRHDTVNKSQSVWSMASFPKERKTMLSRGAPCENEYLEFEIE